MRAVIEKGPASVIKAPPPEATYWAAGRALPAVRPSWHAASVPTAMSPGHSGCSVAAAIDSFSWAVRSRCSWCGPGLALDARARRLAVVSDDATISPAARQRLGVRLRSGCTQPTRVVIVRRHPLHRNPLAADNSRRSSLRRGLGALDRQHDTFGLETQVRRPPARRVRDRIRRSGVQRGTLIDIGPPVDRDDVDHLCLFV